VAQLLCIRYLSSALAHSATGRTTGIVTLPAAAAVAHLAAVADEWQLRQLQLQRCCVLLLLEPRLLQLPRLAIPQANCVRVRCKAAVICAAVRLLLAPAEHL
jgi:hypothetical protein